MFVQAGPRLLQAFVGGGEGPNVVQGRQLNYGTWSQLPQAPQGSPGIAVNICELGSVPQAGPPDATSLSTPKATAQRLAL